jgi:hypothetical protein
MNKGEKRMKTHINLLAACFSFASVLMVPQAAHALTAPCTVASLTGGYGYELRGFTNPVSIYIQGVGLLPVSSTVVTQVGRLYFNGDGTFSNKLTFTSGKPDSPVGSGAFYEDLWEVTQGTYTITSDCTKGTLIFHGQGTPYQCVHLAVAFSLQVGLLGNLTYGQGLPTLAVTPFFADAALSCTDQFAEAWVPTMFVSNYTGTMAQQ